MSPSSMSTFMLLGDTYSLSPYHLLGDTYMSPLTFQTMFICRLYFNYPTHICRCKTFFSPPRSHKATHRDVSPHGKKKMCRLLACRHLCYQATHITCRLIFRQVTHNEKCLMSPNFLLGDTYYMSPYLLSGDT